MQQYVNSTFSDFQFLKHNNLFICGSSYLYQFETIYLLENLLFKTVPLMNKFDQPA